ncbi:methionyl-tRNA formyltransferase [Liquorilactobacillus vini]|uniref:Methionyl-tRNA formyltransferase n=1 Tax=Liquorilactobacillus vini DSM 20605 TaxID=1133569 RepID=A0A0R2CD65_9LACO|nr:methionyl-tRNA formyltransferase [Liquorilactobacillus vini]KRM89232.1 methionyl-tRNA formyltransferase [Liquorilactobacillus vini DSM 20605]
MATIIFMGTPIFAAEILKGILTKTDHQVMGVVTQPDRYTGRKKVLTASPVKQLAKKHRLKVYQPERLARSQELTELLGLHADLIITAAYGQFLPEKLIKSVKIAAINVHGSLLPKYRGGAPIQYSLINNDQQTGITLIYMTKKMDAGAMLAQKTIKIMPEDDAGSLFKKLSVVGEQLLLQELPMIIAGQVRAVEQDETAVTFAPIITAAQEKLSLAMTAHQLDGMIRALRPRPGAYFANFAGKRTKIWQIKPLPEKTELAAGQIVAIDHRLLKIAAAKGTVYQLEVLQPAGKAKQSIRDYLNGQGQNLTVKQRLITE